MLGALARLRAAASALFGGASVVMPRTGAVVHSADAVLVRRGLGFYVAKDRMGETGGTLSLLGVALLRGRRFIVILDTVDRVLAVT